MKSFLVGSYNMFSVLIEDTLTDSIETKLNYEAKTPKAIGLSI